MFHPVTIDDQIRWYAADFMPFTRTSPRLAIQRTNALAAQYIKYEPSSSSSEDDNIEALGPANFHGGVVRRRIAKRLDTPYGTKKLLGNGREPIKLRFRDRKQLTPKKMASPEEEPQPAEISSWYEPKIVEIRPENLKNHHHVFDASHYPGKLFHNGHAVPFTLHGLIASDTELPAGDGSPLRPSVPGMYKKNHITLLCWFTLDGELADSSLLEWQDPADGRRFLVNGLGIMARGITSKEPKMTPKDLYNNANGCTPKPLMHAMPGRRKADTLPLKMEHCQPAEMLYGDTIQAADCLPQTRFQYCFDKEFIQLKDAYSKRQRFPNQDGQKRHERMLAQFDDCARRHVVKFVRVHFESATGGNSSSANTKEYATLALGLYVDIRQKKEDCADWRKIGEVFSTAFRVFGRPPCHSRICEHKLVVQKCPDPECREDCRTQTKKVKASIEHCLVEALEREGESKFDLTKALAKKKRADVRKNQKAIEDAPEEYLRRLEVKIEPDMHLGFGPIAGQTGPQQVAAWPEFDLSAIMHFDD